MKELTIDALIAMANSNNGLMDGSMDPVRKIMADHDVVVAVWQDFKSLGGFATSVIKGASILRNVVAQQANFNGPVTAIKCMGPEQAHHLQEVCGDSEPLH